MRIGWIGGLSRNKAQLEKIAKARGHRLEFHSGDMAGRGAADLRSLLERVDFQDVDGEDARLERAEIKHVRASTPPRAEVHRPLDARPCAPSPEARR